MILKKLGRALIKTLVDHLNTAKTGNQKTIHWNTSEKELQFWKDFLKNGDKNDFFSSILERTNHLHNPKYIGHQVASPAPNNCAYRSLGSLAITEWQCMRWACRPQQLNVLLPTAYAKK